MRDKAVLAAAAKWSGQVFPDRFPDKAVYMVNETCAKVENEITFKPAMRDEK